MCFGFHLCYWFLTEKLQQLWAASHSPPQFFLRFLSDFIQKKCRRCWTCLKLMNSHYQVFELSASPVKMLVCCTVSEKSYMTVNLSHKIRSAPNLSSVRAPVKHFHHIFQQPAAWHSYSHVDNEAVLSLVSKYIAERHKVDFSDLFWFLWPWNRADGQWPLCHWSQAALSYAPVVWSTKSCQDN